MGLRRNDQGYEREELIMDLPELLAGTKFIQL